MTVFQREVDATFAAFGIDATYAPAGSEAVSVRVIARRPDTIVGFGETRIHAETGTFEVRASEIASPRPGDELTVVGETFVVQGEPERRDPDRLVWSLDVRAGGASLKHQTAPCPRFHLIACCPGSDGVSSGNRRKCGDVHPVVRDHI
jgi:hypothetical protein